MIPIAKPWIGKEEKDLVSEVMDSGLLAQGPKVKELEQKFAELCKTKYAVAVNSGTAAIHTALYAAGIKKGDEVITVPFTFVATANAVIMQGAMPVFADIKEDTFNINPESVLEKITEKTKAILTVDLYGQPCDYPELNKIAEKYNLKIIEDACQAVNASLSKKMAGSFGSAGAFSFYATKNMISGEGGILTTDCSQAAELAKRFRHHGQSEQTRYEYHDLGYNYRMSDLHAAIALAQLEKLEFFTQRRIENAGQLSKGLLDVKGIAIPYVKPDARHVFHQYTIKVDGFKLTRDELIGHLKKKEIGCGVYYPKPLHMHPFYIGMGYQEGDFPVSERLAKQVISLPVHPSVSPEDIKKIISAIKEAA